MPLNLDGNVAHGFVGVYDIQGFMMIESDGSFCSRKFELELKVWNFESSGCVFSVIRSGFGFINK